MQLPVQHITLPRPKDRYTSPRSLSEQLAKRRLSRKGYLVTRGSMLDCFFERTGFEYSIPANRITRTLIAQLGMKSFLRIAKYCARNHGTPDYLAFHPARGVLAVEVKLGHERVMPHQLLTMQRLMEWRIPCVVWRFMPAKNRVQEKQIDLAGWSRSGDLRKSTKKCSYDERVKKRYK